MLSRSTATIYFVIGFVAFVWASSVGVMLNEAESEIMFSGDQFCVS